ncbi:SDR family NAD(P)-dependent oxidoreductase [Aliiglaciecola lipolytica]|uniref:Oxidoreductase, short-chain dehydrogenase/reductase n=1 Tax=Aliiglaciecola lipolytica E3 TaxID=1127673 RepID=K6YT87_9ALTE|nr:SDR family oxidoreductase [Aliiglaciecola lipolytica]GAC14510.1 oxidoreductase, short-chain dehydrogenase/reductase [Aliiglaciecola lipolytica E3]
MSKIALITGASRGIGRATALAFAAAGYNIAITAREFDNTDSVKHKITNNSYAEGSLVETAKLIEKTGVDILAIRMDLLSSQSVNDAIVQVFNQFGGVDVLINNAIYQGPTLNDSLLSLTSETLEKVAKAYFYAPLQITQAVIPSMVQKGSGCIINITSGAGEINPPVAAADGGWGYAYGAGKAAVSRLSGIINIEHGHEGVRAFTVNPGIVNTETLRATISEQDIKKLGQSVALPSDVADLLLWIAQHAGVDLQHKTIDAQRLSSSLSAVNN